MKSPVRFLSHLGAALLGVALAASAPGLFPKRSDNNRKTDPDGSGNRLPAASRRPDLPVIDSRIAGFEQAWVALRSRPTSVNERFNLQIELLGKWAEVDLKGAMGAALEEPWTDTRSGLHPMGSAFHNVFSEQPLETWKLLAGDMLGPGVQLMRRNWIVAVCTEDRMLVASMLGEIPTSLHADVMKQSIIGKPLSADERAAYFEKLGGTGTPAQAEKLVQMAAKLMRSSGDPAELHDQWAGMPEGSPRIIAMTEWAAALRFADTATFTAEWDRIPEADRDAAARSILSQISPASPAFLPAIDSAIEAGAWDSLQPELTAKLRYLTDSPQELADWAMTLPARRETTGLYHRAVEHFLASDPAAGREWLEALPAGDWHRELGFIELSQVSLWRNGDLAASRAAIDSITDPAARRIALNYRHDWELITGQEEVGRE